jgi:hypothetical protein
MQKSKVPHNGGKGTNYVSDSPPAARSISQKEMEPERAWSLEKPSPHLQCLNILTIIVCLITLGEPIGTMIKIQFYFFSKYYKIYHS